MYKDLDVVKELLEAFSGTRDQKSWIKFYKPKLIKFFTEFLDTPNKNQLPFHKVDSLEINEFLDTITKPILKLNYYNALSAFYNFAYNVGKTSDVMKNVIKPSTPKKSQPKYIKDEHIKLIKEFIDRDNESFSDRMLLAFFLYTGLSREYIFNLYNYQICMDNKGVYYLWLEDIGQQRQVPLNNKLQELLVNYKNKDGTGNPYSRVFDYSETYISTKVKKLSEIITGSSYSPQNFQNTFIKLALLENNDIYSVGKLTLKSLSAIEKHIKEPDKLIQIQQRIVNNI